MSDEARLQMIEERLAKIEAMLEELVAKSREPNYLLGER